MNSVQERPRIIQFIKRYALAEVAAVVGVPLAVLGVFLTALTTRDNARQLESSNQQLRLAKASAQPTFYLAHSPGRSKFSRLESTAQVPAYDRLILAVSGNAEDVSATAVSALVSGTERETWREEGPKWKFAPVEIFSQVVSPAERSLQWAVSPVVVDQTLSGIAYHLNLITIIEVKYRDVFGEYQFRYFRLTDFPKSVSSNESPFVEQPYGVAQDVHLQRCMGRLGMVDIVKPEIGTEKILTGKELGAASTKAIAEDVANCGFGLYNPTSPWSVLDLLFPASDVAP